MVDQSVFHKHESPSTGTLQTAAKASVAAPGLDESTLPIVAAALVAGGILGYALNLVTHKVGLERRRD